MWTCMLQNKSQPSAEGKEKKRLVPSLEEPWGPGKALRIPLCMPPNEKPSKKISNITMNLFISAHRVQSGTPQTTEQGECDKLMRVEGCVKKKNKKNQPQQSISLQLKHSMTIRLTKEVSKWILASKELPKHLIWTAECEGESWEVIGKRATTGTFEK